MIQRTVVLWMAVLAFAAMATTTIAQAPPPEIRRSTSEIAFRRNDGQWPAPVQYAARAGPIDAFLVPNGFVLSLFDERTRERASGQNLAFRWEQSSASAWRGSNQLPGLESHFFGGREPKCVIDVPRYDAAEYAHARPGIGIRFHHAAGALEYDLEVAPGADPAQLRIRCDGAESIAVAADGALEIRTMRGVLRQPKPRAFQTEASGARSAVECNYAVDDDHDITFVVSGRDPRRPLTIDPSLLYSTYLGGSKYDTPSDLAIDDVGAAYVCGWTFSFDFPTTPGAFNSIHALSQVVGFLTKFNPQGAFVFSTYVNGSAGYGVAVDAAHNVYYVGHGDPFTFPTTPGSYNPTGNNVDGTGAAAIAKFTPGGNSLVYGTYLGGKSTAYAVVVDGQGQAYLCGSASQTGGAPPFPTTPHAFMTTGGTFKQQAFVTKLNAAGSALVYSTLVGEPPAANAGDSVAMGIAVDGAGNAFICGETKSPQYPVTAGVVQTNYGGGYSNGFATKLNNLGTALAYSTFLGGNGPFNAAEHENAKGIAVDPNGFAYVSGHSNSPNFPTTPGSFKPGPSASDQGFLAKLDPAGASFVYSTLLGSSNSSGVGKFQLQNDGAVDIAGWTRGIDLPTTPGAFQATFQGGYSDGIYLRVNPLGTGLLYSTYLGGPNDSYEQALGAAVGPDGVVRIFGFTNSNAFPNALFSVLNLGISSPGPTPPFDAFVSWLTPDLSGGGVGNYGAGSAGCLGPHSMKGTYPKVGNALFSLSSTAAPSSALGLALVADIADASGPDPFQVGIHLLLDLPASTTILGIDLPSNGVGGNAAVLPIPNVSWLAGQAFHAQAVWLWPQGPLCGPAWNPPFGLSSSDGLWIQIQP